MNKEQIQKLLLHKEVENLSSEEISELIWMANAHLYKERPVTINEFISSDSFVRKKWPNIYPIWKDTLNQIYPNPFSSPYNEVLISAAAGAGKCLGKSTKILMYDETVKNVEDVVIGDLLMGPDKTPRKVLSLARGKELMYRFTLEDGSSFTCNKSHILTLQHNSTYHHINIEEVYNNISMYEDYYALKYNDQTQYSFSIEKLNVDEYFGFTIQPIKGIKITNSEYCFVANDIITHNTVTATIGNIYDMYKLGCLKDPCSFYGLSPGTMLIFAIFSATGTTAAVNWNDMTTAIEMCPWINDKVIDRRGLEKKNGSLVPVEILPGIYIQTGSKFQHSMGKAIFDGLMDEAAFGGDNIKEAQKTYNELSSRMATRFRSFSEKGDLPGQLFLISSPKEAGDFMQYRIDKAIEAGSTRTLIKRNISSWDANPANDSDNKFTVFVGNEFKEPKIYDENENPAFEDIDYLIYPPMSYVEEFKKDLIGSIMNYGGVTTIADTGLFKSPSLLNESMVLQNPFNSNIIKIPFDKNEKQLMDFMNMDYFKDIRNPEANRFIHIDIAFSSNTLDRYGIAAGYCVPVDRNVYSEFNEGKGTLQDIFTKSEKMYYIDWALGIEPYPGQEIPLSKIRDFVFYLMKKLNYPVASISADTFQSKQTLQDFELEGYNTESISVDRSRDPYLFLNQLVSNKQLILPKFDELKKELLQLRDNGKKIDHPIGGCFTDDTVIALVDGRKISIKQLLLEQQYKQNWVYTINEKTRKIEPKPIKKVFQSKLVKNLVRVTLDNDEIITCTPEHLFMLRDGTYEQIQNLKIGTSLMPLYTKESNKGLIGYRLIYQPFENKWFYEHRNWFKNIKKGYVVHHCNFNKKDNTLSNLKILSKQEHTILHNNRTKDYDVVSNKLKLYHAKFKNSDDYYKWSEKISKSLIQTAIKKNNGNLTDNRIKIVKKDEFIKELESYYNLDYSKLTPSEKDSYATRYRRIKDPSILTKISNGLKKAHKNGNMFKLGEYCKGKCWVTNGLEDLYIDKSEPIPDGYFKGRCKIGKKYKNHKIKRIEFIKNPCKVYDLEIMDNHNFALASGVFVHNSKDIADAVCGCIWNASNSKNIISISKITRAMLNPHASVNQFKTASEDELKSLEMMEFERLRGTYSNTLFKGL